MVISTRKLLLAMYLLSAVSLKRSKKNGPNNLRLPSFVDVLEVKSSVRGRVRFYAPIIKQNPNLGVGLVENFKHFPKDDIYSLSVNSLTGSIVVKYNPDKVDVNILQGAIIKLLGMDEVLLNGRDSKISTQTKGMYKALNNGIYDFSRGWLDIKTLVAGGFLIWAYRCYRTAGLAAPGATTLVWWTSSLF